MKKKILLLGIGILILFAFLGCPTPTNPEVKKFTVSFDTDGGIPEPPSQKVKSGEKAVKPADPVKEGCVFLYWQDQDENEFDFETKILKDIKLKAYYLADTEPHCFLSISVNPEEAGRVSISPNRRIFLEGETLTLTAIANPGYVFTNWSGDATGNEQSLTIDNIQSHMAITACFEEAYKISYSIQNATITLDPQKDWYKTGEEVSLTILPHEGYQFTGWTGDLNGKDREKTITVATSDISFGANIVERWLVLIHFALDNDIDYDFETNYDIISNYLATLADVKNKDEDDVMDILLLMDGYDKTDPRQNEYDSPFTDGYYEISGGDFDDDLKRATGEINSGDVKTSKDFIDWVYSNYKGKRHFYSVFNHGSGFDDPNLTATFGIGFDDSHGGDSLSHNELAQVLSYLKTKAGKKVDIFYPYACLMGGIELAWEVKNSADYLLSSQEVFPADYWSYEALEKITSDPQISSLNLGKAFCDSAYDYFLNIDRDFTLSLVDLSELQPLYYALDSLAKVFNYSMQGDLPESLNAAALSGLMMNTPYYTDIGCLMETIDSTTGASSYTAAVNSALSSAVKYHRNFTSNGFDYYKYTTGLTIFHNIWEAQWLNIAYNPATYKTILQFGKNNAWGAYMQNMWDRTPPKPETGIEADSYEPDGLDDPVNNILGKGIANKQHHTFHLYEGDIDVMAVDLVAGTTYTFMTEAGPLGADTYMVLLDPSGAYIDEHDDIDYPNNLYSKITYEAEETARYFLVIVDEYRKYGDYYVYYDEGVFGPSLGKTFRKWTPDRKDKESYKISLP